MNLKLGDNEAQQVTAAKINWGFVIVSTFFF